ncbi:hypothetical protein [Natrinema sp. SYSU A 869]|uniref:hypothetical protein n=1 Tax=Natrinema sp. SYSU A 869 TaxID=2871694 RepID=UPI001CA46A2A|nr:hypothetical protein [Natrinema sp. SYSU A 869]
MGDRNTADRDSKGSRIATNRAAVAIAVSSLLIAAVITLLSQWGLLDPLIEFLVARGVAVDALPMYLLFALLLCWLVVWSWRRMVSLFR